MRIFNTIVLLGASIGLLVLRGVFLSYYGRLPEVIPTHFGLSGVPNGWGPKTTLLLFPLLGSVAYGMALLFQFAVIPASKRVTPIVQSLVFLMLAELVWFWIFLQWETIRVGSGYAAGLGNGFNILLGIIILTVVVMLICAVVSRPSNSVQ